MPLEPIFDLSSIDLTRRVLGHADIARYNPHRGAMVMIDGIVWHDEGLTCGVAAKEVLPDEFWTAGHIPGRPIMPGVLMIEGAAQLSSFLYYKRSGLTGFAGFTRIEDVSFRGMVVPGDTLLLLAREVKYSLKRFITDVQGVVKGQVVFDGRITGMVFPTLGEVDRTALESDATLASTKRR